MKTAAGLVALLGLAFTLRAARPEEKSVLVVPIEGEINTAQRAFVKRVAERIRDEKPDLVLFEIDTPGGDGLSMTAICETILTLNDEGVQTAAFIRRSNTGRWVAGTAASAGAFISIACRRIYMTPTSVIGASQPVTAAPGGGMESAGGKIISLFKKKIAAYAKQNGYPVDLAVAMVDPDHEVYVAETEGDLRFFSEQQREAFEKENPDTKLERVTEKGQPLTLTVDEAVRFGLATKAKSSEAVLKAEELEGAAIRTEGFTWSETFVGFITQPMIQSILMLLAMALAYGEIKTPGFGVFGISSIGLFSLLFFGHHLAGLASAIELVFILVGLILIAVEIFAIPGTIFTGILGAILVITGLLMMLLPSISWDFQNPLEVGALLSAGVQVSVSFVLATVVFLLLARYMPHIPGVNRLVLKASVGSGTDGAGAGPSPLVGKTGVSTTRLAPGGRAEIEGGILDVVAESGYVESGRPVRVVSVQGSRIVVESVED